VKFHYFFKMSNRGWIIAICAIIVIALGFGLGFGLTKESTNETPFFRWTFCTR